MQPDEGARCCGRPVAGFCEECGRDPRATRQVYWFADIGVRADGGHRWTWSLPRRPVRIGRCTAGVPAPDIAVDLDPVDHHHARLYPRREEPGWAVLDDGSRLGTFVRHDGVWQRATVLVPVGHGDRIELGGERPGEGLLRVDLRCERR